MNTIEIVKDFWNLRPCNIKHSNEVVGTKEYFHQVENKRYFVEPHISEFAEFWKWKNKKVLEIGCGIGTDTLNFARHGANITAVELSKKSLEITKRRFKIFGCNGKFYQGNSEELDKFLPVQEFDLIYSFGVIHHTPNPKKIIDQIKKYCHNNTEIRIMLYSKWSWKVLKIIFKNGIMKFWNFKEFIRKNSEAQYGSPITYVYTKKQIKKLLKDFKIINIEKDHIFQYKIKDYINHIYIKEKIFEIMPGTIFSFMKKFLGWHLLIKARKI